MSPEELAGALDERARRHHELYPTNDADRLDRDAAHALREQAAEVGRLRVEVASETKRADEAEYELSELTCVMDAKFRAAMTGAALDDLDVGVTPEHLKREQDALVRIVEKHGAAFAKLRAVAEAARVHADWIESHVPTDVPTMRALRLALRALDDTGGDDAAR